MDYILQALESEKLKKESEEWQQEKKELIAKLETAQKKHKKDEARVIKWEEKKLKMKEACEEEANKKFAVELQRDSSLLAWLRDICRKPLTHLRSSKWNSKKTMRVDSGDGGERCSY